MGLKVFPSEQVTMCQLSSVLQGHVNSQKFLFLSHSKSNSRKSHS